VEFGKADPDSYFLGSPVKRQLRYVSMFLGPVL
jgi:hypothetical protein